MHVGLWEGWGFLYDHGDDPATAPGMAALYVSDERPRWWQWGRQARAGRDELRRAQAEAAAELAAMRVEGPAAASLDYPHRSRFLWTGPLGSALALRRHDALPSVVWPEDRSWFVGIPEYTREAALGGSAELVATVLDDARLGARAAAPGTELDIDD
ncbi:hypothetical protein ACFQ80_17400 [Isoptericola sp. NPDC056578]|uniref:hypothetical protein n=1 Tax=Isoptericola sp. NPDC056578 TaxID=3345870 RepID=UPI003689418D